MKKLYSFILTALLLLGVSNVWGTDYYIGHNGPLSGGSDWVMCATPMTHKANGIYYQTFSDIPSGNVCFRIFTANNWTGKVADYSNFVANLSDCNWEWSEGGDNNIGIKYSSTETITIYYNSNTGKVFVRKSLNKWVTVNVTVSSNPKLYAYNSDDEDIHYNGDWSSLVANTNGNKGTYQFTLSIPNNDKVKLIFTNGTYQSCIFDLGTITSDSTFNYHLSSSYTWDLLLGTFNDWTVSDTYALINGEITLTLEANTTYRFKVYKKEYQEASPKYKEYWYGYYSYGEESDPYRNDPKKTFTLTEKNFGLYDGQRDVAITTTVEGNYKFIWNGSQISVLYETYERTGLAKDKWGTICLPVAGEIDGADLYEVLGKNAGILYLTQIASGELVAGNPYIFQSSGTSLSVELDNDSYDASANTIGGLYGTYTATTIDGSSDALYAVSNNKVMRASSACNIGANRAWLNLTDDDDMKVAGTAVPDYDPDGAPGRRIVAIAFEGNNATDFDVIEASDKAVKFFQNGELRILRNGVVYDTTGRAIH